MRRSRILCAAPLVAILLLAAAAHAQTAPTADYVVDGAEAWAEASRRGFEFHPVIPDDRFILAGPRDGAWASLKSCGAPGEPCRTEAQVLDGRMVVHECADACEDGHEFRLFSGRALAPGWSVEGVDLDGDGWTWVRRPAAGSDDASFSVRLRARPGEPATASVRQIRLTGPAGSDWRAAFAEP